MLIERYRKIAVLIDADNAQASKIEDILKDISAYGRIVTKRAYANWAKPQLKPWEKEVKRFAIGTIQQFDFVAGKNASDMALTIDAMNLLFTGNYDCFVIVSSDSDFTALSMKLHESGVFVVGYGNKQTVDSFRNACDEFNYVEDLTQEDKTSKMGIDSDHIDKSVDVLENSHNQSKKDLLETDETSLMSEDELDALLKKAEEKYAGDDGFVNVASAGTYIKRVRSDFNIKALGYNKLPEYIKDKGDKYEVVERQGKGVVKLIMYRSISV